MCIYTAKKQTLKINKKVLQGGARNHQTAEKLGVSGVA